MNEYDTSHILFSFTKQDGTKMSDEEKAELKTKAEAVLTRALSGEDFAQLAQENSDDTATATEGGKYTMYMDDYTVDAYANAVASMQVGEISATLVESPYGYHIIKLNDKIENGRLKNETEREEYVNTLFNDITTKKNLAIDDKKLNKFLKEIDPESYSQEDDSKDGSEDGTDGEGASA